MASPDSSLIRFTEPALAKSPVIRIRESRPDPFQGLKGHDYIKARNLNPPVQRVQTSAHTGLAASAVEVCK